MVAGLLTAPRFFPAAALQSRAAQSRGENLPLTARGGFDKWAYRTRT